MSDYSQYNLADRPSRFSSALPDPLVVGSLIVNNNAIFNNGVNIGGTLHAAANVIIDGALTLGSPLDVPDGGTGAASFTAHSLLLGEGAAAIAPLGAATNGQIPIGSTGADPVLAAISAGYRIAVTNGAGSISIAQATTAFPVITGGTAFAGPDSTTSAVITGLMNFYADASYFYFTVLTGTAAQTASLWRFNRSTGAITSLNLNGSTRAVGAIYFDGVDIWVATIGTSGTTTQIAYKVNVGSFTVTSTHTGTSSSNTDSVNDLYVASSVIYTNGGNGTGTTAWLTSWAVGGGAVTHLNLNGTGGTTNKARKMTPYSTTHIFVIVDDPAISTTKLVKVAISGFTVTATYTTVGAKWNANYCINESDTTIWFPVFFNSGKSGTLACDINCGLVAFDIVGTTFTSYPLANISETAGANANFLTHMLLKSGYIYLLTNTNSSSRPGTMVTRFKTADKTYSGFWFPWFANSAVGSANAINTDMFADTDGLPVLFRQTGGAQDFEYFKPTLPT